MVFGFDRGVVAIFFSSMLSALNGAMAKMLGDDMSALEIVFFRNLFGVGLILYALYHTQPKLKGGNIKLLIWRGLFGFFAMLMFFYTIVTIPLGEAVTLNKTSPLFVSILAFLLLKQNLSPKGIIALIVGFVGVVLITKPFGISVGLPHLLGLFGGFLAAAAYTTIGKIKEIYDSRVIVLSFMGTGVVIPLLLFLLAPYINVDGLEFLFSEFVMPNGWRVWGLLLFMAFTATASQWLLTVAYSSSKAAIVGIVSYSIIPFSILFGWILGDNLPDMMTIFGIVLIVIAGISVKRG